MRPRCSLQPTNVTEPQVESKSFHRRAFLAATMLMLLAVAACLPQNSLAQQAAAAGPHAGAGQAVSTILIPAPLASALDSKKLKAGDEVTLTTTALVPLTNGISIPHGTRIFGHVTEAKAKSRGDAQSSLAMQFDKLSFPDGKTVAITGAIKAVGPSLSAANSEGGGVTYSNNMSRTTYMPSVSADQRPVPLLTNESVGVVGIKNLRLNDGVLSSDSKSVKLDSGSQILLQVEVPSGLQGVQ